MNWKSFSFYQISWLYLRRNSMNFKNNFNAQKNFIQVDLYLRRDLEMNLVKCNWEWRLTENLENNESLRIITELYFFKYDDKYDNATDRCSIKSSLMFTILPTVNHILWKKKIINLYTDEIKYFINSSFQWFSSFWTWWPIELIIGIPTSNSLVQKFVGKVYLR